MSSYDTAQICLNRHIINTSIEDSPPDQVYCSTCGATTITECPKCHAQLRGFCHDSDFIELVKATAYCYHCGKPYPWTESALKSANLIIQEAENFSEKEKATLVESLPDIIAETPKTILAISRTQRFLKAVGGFSADAIRQFAIDFGCEFAKKQLGL
jgi:hypothetical protein